MVVTSDDIRSSNAIKLQDFISYILDNRQKCRCIHSKFDLQLFYVIIKDVRVSRFEAPIIKIIIIMHFSIMQVRV